MRIDEMEAGRELDALVAEQILGWEREERRKSSYLPWPHWVAPNGTAFIELPRFSEDVGEAWEVVEKLKMRCGYSHGRGDPFAMLECEKSDTLVVYADTVPLAICRAALKAVGIEEV